MNDTLEKLVETEALLLQYKEAFDLVWGNMSAETRKELDFSVNLQLDTLLGGEITTPAINELIAKELESMASYEHLFDNHGKNVLRTRAMELRNTK